MAAPEPSNRLPPDLILIEKVTDYVKQYMSQYDASHDFDHVLRVLGLTRRIASSPPSPSSDPSSDPSPDSAQGQAQAPQLQSSPPYNPLLLTLSALLHDVGDKKYLQANANENPETMVYDLLTSFGAPHTLSETVQKIVSNVSFSAETQSAESRERVRRLVAEVPELGVVQDADRLDAIGAVGIGRAFTFGGAMGGKEKEKEKANGKGRGMQETIQHFVDKLEALEALMKTDEGRRLAVERTRRLRLFREWWGEEIGVDLGIH